MAFIPNTFQIPNAIVDKMLSKISGNELKIYMIIIRNTTGWHVEKSKELPTIELMKISGMSKPTVLNATKKLSNLKLIRSHGNAKKGYNYSVKFEIKEERKPKSMVKILYHPKPIVWSKFFTASGQNSLPLAVKKIDHWIHILKQELKTELKPCGDFKKTEENKEINFSVEFTKLIDELKMKISWRSKISLDDFSRKKVLNDFIDLTKSDRFRTALVKTNQSPHQLVCYFYKQHVIESGKYAKKIGDFILDFFAVVEEIQKQTKPYGNIEELEQYLVQNFKRRIFAKDVAGYKSDVTFSISMYGQFINNFSGGEIDNPTKAKLLNYLFENPNKIQSLTRRIA